MKKHTLIRSTVFFTASIALLLVCAAWFNGFQLVCAESEVLVTEFPATAEPDQVCLTWSGDPATTQTIQWRSSKDTAGGVVQYRPASPPDAAPVEVTAATHVLEEPRVSNDPVNHRHTARLEGLTPGTTYAYRVGNGESWSAWHEFTTAPAGDAPFSFAYMGDPQMGLDTWGELVRGTFERHPQAAFFVVAGDNVNRGGNRDEWDNLFHAGSGVFDRRPYVPTLGNHDCRPPEGPSLYLDLLTLPENGPASIGPERAYAFTYSNALFLVLDSNASIEAQAAWLEEQLKASRAVWKFAVYHHPAYSSAPRRDNVEVREIWGALFDRHHVDMVLQGHDHGYLRTKPMRAGQAAATPAEGTVYIVSVSGTKLYDVGAFDYAEKTLDHVSTCQVIDIETAGGNKLTYRAYDASGAVVDEFSIVKP